MNRQYDTSIPWDGPVSPRYRAADRVSAPERAIFGPSMGVLFVFLFFQAASAALGVIVLALTDRLSSSGLAWLVGGTSIPLFLLALILVVRIISNASRVTVVELPAEPAEVVRYVRLSVNDGYVDPRDMAFFLNRIEVTGNSGQKSIRGLPFPSGRRGSDSYHTELVQALVDAGVWARGKGTRKGGRLSCTPDEALAALGLEGLI